MFCKNCGAPIEPDAHFCKKCGYSIDIVSKETQESRSRFSPVSRPFKRAEFYFLLVILIAVLIGLLFFYFIKRPSRNGYFNGCPWGISYDDFIKQYSDPNGTEYDKNPSDNLKEYIIYRNSLSSIDGAFGIETYEFTNDKLQSVSYLILPQKDSATTCDDIALVMYKSYKALYGKPQESDDSIRYVWATSKSNIEIFNTQAGVVYITFKDISCVS